MPQLFNKIVADTPEQQAKIEEIMRRGEEERRQIARENLLANARIAGGALLSGASALPFFNIPYIGTGIGGAMEGAGQAIMQGKSGKDIAKDAGIGFAIGETVGAIPYAGKLAGKTKAGQAVAKKASGLYDKIIHTDAGIKAANALDRDVETYVAPLYRKIKFAQATGTSPLAKSNAQVAYDALDEQFDDAINSSKAFENEMANFDLAGYSPEEIKVLINKAKNYYKLNLKPRDAIRNDMGNIRFTNSGAKEQVGKGLHNIDVFTDLREQIEKGVKHPEPRYDYVRKDIDRFYIINNKFKNKDMEYQIANDVNGNRFYFAKDITKNKDLLPANRNQKPAPETSPINSISDDKDNFNSNAGLYNKIVDNAIPDGYKRLYRGLTQEYKSNYDRNLLDNVNGYESWTDNYELAKAYGDNVYYIDIPENSIAKDIMDENPKSLTFGDRNLLYENDKPVGIKGKNGKEYMLYTYHENYPNIKYNKF